MEQRRIDTQLRHSRNGGRAGRFEGALGCVDRRPLIGCEVDCEIATGDEGAVETDPVQSADERAHDSGGKSEALCQLCDADAGPQRVLLVISGHGLDHPLSDALLFESAEPDVSVMEAVRRCPAAGVRRESIRRVGASERQEGVGPAVRGRFERIDERSRRCGGESLRTRRIRIHHPATPHHQSPPGVAKDEAVAHRCRHRIVEVDPNEPTVDVSDARRP